MTKINFKQAKLLKGLGFPQPNPEFGQMWYNNAGTTRYVITDVSDDKCTYVPEGAPIISVHRHLLTDEVYIPQNDEIQPFLRKPKTILEWFLVSRDFHGYEWADLAIKNISNPNNVRLSHLSSALHCAFDWGNTEQGYEYWENIYNSL